MPFGIIYVLSNLSDLSLPLDLENLSRIFFVLLRSLESWVLLLDGLLLLLLPVGPFPAPLVNLVF